MKYFGRCVRKPLCEPSPDGDGALVHRQDVRALMLPAILREVQGPRVKFTKRRCAITLLVPDDAESGLRRIWCRGVSELYHRLMLGEDRKTLGPTMGLRGRR